MISAGGVVTPPTPHPLQAGDREGRRRRAGWQAGWQARRLAGRGIAWQEGNTKEDRPEANSFAPRAG